MSIQVSFGNRHNGVPRDTAGLRASDTLPHQMMFLDQVHGTDVVIIDAAALNHIHTADAMVTFLPGLGLAIKTADCAPVLLYDETAGVIGAVHSGWLGTLHNIIAPTIDAMCRTGARADRIKALIGPCLQRNNFAMGQDIYDRFLAQRATHAQYFQPIENEPQKFLFDHLRLLTWQLQQSGITHITPDEHCTLAQSDIYYSHRARHTNLAHDTMRNVSMIWLD